MAILQFPLRDKSGAKHMWRTLGLALAMAMLRIPAIRAQSTVSDIPNQFAAVTSAFDYLHREADIPMRDGVKLHTVLVIPRGISGAPILLDRTPYDAGKATSAAQSSHGDRVVAPAFGAFLRAGYIVVFQDIRGKYGSEGIYVNERPLRGPANRSDVDHATDAWDTIDWLVKNVKESNGRVGMIGTSYDGMMVAMALTHPHPALRAAVAANPVINTWMGDDDFHGGAFRMINFDYYFAQHSVRGDGGMLWRGKYDEYETFMVAGSAGNFMHLSGLDQLPFIQSIHEHPAYDEFWQARALEPILAATSQVVPTLWIAGQWDAEDSHGAFAAFQAVHAHDPQGLNHLVLGPWRHEGWMDDGSALGPIAFDTDTALWFRKSILLPFLDAHLKNGPAVDLSPVLAFQTGANRWMRQDSWPLSCASGCPAKSSRLYLHGKGSLRFDTPAGVNQGSDSYISDPAKAIPYRVRPLHPYGVPESSWSRWLVDDQRPFSDRPDVLVYETPPLEQSVAINGAPIVNLVAASTGTDGDFIVKLIDVYPDEYADKPELGGYQLPIAMDILRGRYRNGFEKPERITPAAALTYRIPLPNVSHTFLPGHRIMVQIQSSWFPLYDRNPQTFIANIFDAKPTDFHPATITIFRSAASPSFVELPTIPAAWK
jgi:putative CocE/NonD family hydrolase